VAQKSRGDTEDQLFRHDQRPRVRWQNFRAFKDTGWIELRPLTVLIGPNNSGKTSIHAPLLLMKQTLQARDESIPLLTNGPLLNSGTFKDIVYGHDANRDIALSIAWHRHQATKEGRQERLGATPPGDLRLAFADDPKGDIVLKSYEVRDVHGRKFLTRNRLQNGDYSLLHMPRRSPSRPAKRNQPRPSPAYMRDIRVDSPDHFLFTPGVIFDTTVRQATRPRKPRSELGLAGPASMYMRIVSWVQGQVTSLLDGLSYIGPLREHPQRLYQLSGEPPVHVGIRGEAAPEVLYRAGRSDLLKDVRKWLRQFELAYDLRCAAVGESGFSIFLKRTRSSPEINLADTGFGISQVLPLIVEGLCEEELSLIVAEQPEIHLNPRLQARLADLFVYLATHGKPVLIETHSEHMVLALRRLIAQGDISSKDVALLFVEKSGDESSIRHVPIQKNGHIEPDDWPAGFFEDILKESLALASAQIAR
jgi:hypothetical protein